MPLYVGRDGHAVNVSGEEEIARFKAAGYSLARNADPSPPKKAPGKTSSRSAGKTPANQPDEK